MGTALAHALASQGNRVAVWDHFPEVVQDIQIHRENSRFLPGIALQPSITACEAATECVTGSHLVIAAVPSRFIIPTFEPVLHALERDAILLNVAKGFAPGTHTPLLSMLGDFTPDHIWVHLAGPCIANELARGQQAFLLMASHSEDAARRTATLFNGHLFECSVTTDVTGAALGGVFKNIYAILLGCLQALNGTEGNLAASAVTLCLAEMVRIAVAHGAEATTLYGLAGLGDLVATGFSTESHNFNFGRRLASGRSTSQIEKEAGLLPEGARAAAMTCAMARSAGIVAPLAEWVSATVAGSPPTLDGVISAMRAASHLPAS